MKVLVTGISGYVARVTLPYLLRDTEVEAIYGLDVRPAGTDHAKLTFIEGDVRSADIERSMRHADVAVHLAFVVTEIADKENTYDINVNGTRRVLEAAKAAGVRHLVLASSISAYGSHPRGADVVTEDTPLRANPDSYYSETKKRAEELIDAFEHDNPDVVVTRLRPSILCGPCTDNFLLRLLSLPVIVYPSANRDGLPLVHEDDVARAFHLAIKRCAPGTFNIAAGNLSYTRLAQILHKRAMPVPTALLRPLLDTGFKLGLSPISSHWLVLGQHPFNVDCQKAKQALGWAPRYSPEEAFKEMVAAWKKN